MVAGPFQPLVTGPALRDFRPRVNLPTEPTQKNAKPDTPPNVVIMILDSTDTDAVSHYLRGTRRRVGVMVGR